MNQRRGCINGHVGILRVKLADQKTTQTAFQYAAASASAKVAAKPPSTSSSATPTSRPVALLAPLSSKRKAILLSELPAVKQENMGLNASSKGKGKARKLDEEENVDDSGFIDISVKDENRPGSSNRQPSTSSSSATLQADVSDRSRKGLRAGKVNKAEICPSSTASRG